MGGRGVRVKSEYRGRSWDVVPPDRLGPGTGVVGMGGKGVSRVSMSACNSTCAYTRKSYRKDRFLKGVTSVRTEKCGLLCP